jgi:hypothetical protein
MFFDFQNLWFWVFQNLGACSLGSLILSKLKNLLLSFREIKKIGVSHYLLAWFFAFLEHQLRLKISYVILKTSYKGSKLRLLILAFYH